MGTDWLKFSRSNFAPHGEAGQPSGALDILKHGDAGPAVWHVRVPKNPDSVEPICYHESDSPPITDFPYHSRCFALAVCRWCVTCSVPPSASTSTTTLLSDHPSPVPARSSTTRTPSTASSGFSSQPKRSFHMSTTAASPTRTSLRTGSSYLSTRTLAVHARTTLVKT
jgi:hypothetical protein